MVKKELLSVKRFLLREEYFGGLLYDRVSEKWEILNRWQTRALQEGEEDYHEIRRRLAKADIAADNYDPRLDDDIVKDMNKEFPALEELASFLEKSKAREVLNSEGLNADQTKIKREMEYPHLSAPLGLFIEITSHCNMACRHCYNAEDREKEETAKNLLSLEEILGFIKQAKEMGVFFIKLQGGETTLHPDWKEIAERCISGGLATTLYTGGYFKHRKKVLEDITKIPFSEIRMTYAGMNETHNLLRPAKPVIDNQGSPTYEELNHTLDFLLENKSNVKLNFVLGKNNMSQVREFVEFMAEKAIKYNKPLDINFGPQRPFGEGFRCPGDPNGSNILEAKEFYEVNSLIQELRGSYLVRNAGMNLVVVFDILAKQQAQKLVPRDLRKDGCGLGERGFSVSYVGDTGICGFMTSCNVLPSGGNIKEQSVEEIWYGSELLNKGRKYEKEQCRGCGYYTNPCQGICPAMALYKTGDWTKGDNGCFKHLIKSAQE